MNKPIVYIEVQGGAVIAVSSTEEISYYVIDHDVLDSESHIDDVFTDKYEPDTIDTQENIEKDIMNERGEET